MRSAADVSGGVGRGYNGAEVIMVLSVTFATCTIVDSFKAVLR